MTTDRATASEKPVHVSTEATLPARPAVRPGPVRAFATRRPVLTLCLLAIGLTVPLQMALLVAGLDVLPGKAAELVFLTGSAVLITGWTGGRAAVRQLFARLLRWRIGAARWLLVLLAMPILTVAVAAATGTLQAPVAGWTGVALFYLTVLAFSALTANLWEELAWTGFVQTRLMSRHGLLRGSLLTAVPFCLIHLPLAFESEGWAATTWHDAFVTWAWLLAALPFFRYLAGTLLADTKGSVLAVGILHGSFNAAGAMAVAAGGWQYVPAVIILALLVAAIRALPSRRPPVLANDAPDRN
jgi:membrane protease YdiL (CAAX protease family)